MNSYGISAIVQAVIAIGFMLYNLSIDNFQMVVFDGMLGAVCLLATIVLAITEEKE